jgi:tRNA acetyltransferase TAN1
VRLCLVFERLNFSITTLAVVLIVLKDFNLIATTYRRTEGQARSELRYLLEQAGDSTPTVDRTGISGVLVAKTTFSSVEAIKKLKEILHERPYEFRYLLRVIPIEKVVRTDLEQIQNAVNELSSNIAEKETFRITVEKRFTSTSSRGIIQVAAANLKRKVNLSNPDKILLIEVVGGLTGITVAKPDEILSVLKEKVL